MGPHVHPLLSAATAAGGGALCPLMGWGVGNEIRRGQVPAPRHRDRGEAGAASCLVSTQISSASPSTGETPCFPGQPRHYVLNGRKKTERAHAASPHPLKRAMHTHPSTGPNARSAPITALCPPAAKCRKLPFFLWKRPTEITNACGPSEH